MLAMYRWLCCTHHKHKQAKRGNTPRVVPHTNHFSTSWSQQEACLHATCCCISQHTKMTDDDTNLLASAPTLIHTIDVNFAPTCTTP